MLTVPAIKTILTDEAKDEGFTASLLLATAEAVGSPLSSACEQQLRDIGKREPQGDPPASAG
jgi:hypothetical protein